MSDTDTDKMAHARSNAMGWMETIRELVARMNADSSACLHEGEDGHDCDEAITTFEGDKYKIDSDGVIYRLGTVGAIEEWYPVSPDYAAKKKELFPKFIPCAFPEDDDQDAAREEIQEGPLSVMLRGSWAPGEAPEADEFEILLSTGGPALRIMGDLNDYKEPTRAYLEMQDWGTPWTPVFLDHNDTEALLAYTQQFYFGE